ncbi:MAG: hypothetical protein WC526_02485 [Patescibacteria group bacterium]
MSEKNGRAEGSSFDEDTAAEGEPTLPGSHRPTLQGIAPVTLQGIAPMTLPDDPAREFDAAPDTVIPPPVPFGGPPEPGEEEGASAPASTNSADDQQEMVTAALAQEVLGTLTHKPPTPILSDTDAPRELAGMEDEFQQTASTAQGQLPLGIREAMPARPMEDNEQSGPIPANQNDLFGPPSGIMDFAAPTVDLAHANTAVVDTSGVPTVDQAFAPTKPMGAVAVQNGDAPKKGPPPMPPISLAKLASEVKAADLAANPAPTSSPRATLPGVAPAEPVPVVVAPAATEDKSTRTLVREELASEPEPKIVMPEPDPVVAPVEPDPPADDSESYEPIRPPKRKRGGGNFPWGITIGSGLILIMFAIVIAFSQSGREDYQEDIASCVNTLTKEEKVPTAKATEICKRVDADMFSKTKK